MSTSRKERIVVEPMLPQIAKEKFNEWRFQHPELAERLQPADIIVDAIRAADGQTLLRYRIFVNETESRS